MTPHCTYQCAPAQLARAGRGSLEAALRTILFVLACVGLPDLVRGQGVFGTIEGRVTDETAAPIVGASVVIQNRATGFVRMTTTDDAGHFVLVSLPVVGEYDVRVQSPGFASSVRERVTTSAIDTVVLDFTLRVGAQDTIAVGGTVVALARSGATVQQSFGEDLVHTLPLPGRGFLPLASLAAGMTGHPDYPNPHGQMYWTNNVLVDGGGYFSKWRSAARAFGSGIPLEAISEVQTLTALFSAEVGESLAAVTSVRTRAGTNEWHGSALVFVRDAALDAPPPFSRRKPPGGGQQYGFSIGGPLVYDRIHLFAAYEGRRARDHNVVLSPAALDATVPNRQDDHLPFVRVDYQRSGRLFTSRYNGQFFRWHHEPGGLSLPGVGTAYTTNVHTLLATAGLPITARTLGELRFQFSRYVDLRRDSSPEPFASRAGYSTAGGALGPSGIGVDPEDSWEVHPVLTHATGPHALRLGAGIKYVRARSVGVPYGRGAYFFAGSPKQAPQPYLFIQSIAPTANAITARARSVATSFFAQDDWRVHQRLQVNLGVRYDVEHVGVHGFDVPVDPDNVQPRGGIAWALDDSARTIVRGGAGLYSQQHLLFPISRVQLEGPDGAVTLSLAPDTGLLPPFPTTLSQLPVPAPPRDIHRADPAFRNPFALQAAAGVQRAVPGGVVTADFIYLNGRDLMSLLDVNAPASASKLTTRPVAAADASRPIVPAPGGLRKILTLGSEGESWYRALESRFERFTGPLRIVASYTFARAEDMLNYQLPEDSRNPAADKARAATDIRHSVVGLFAWDLPGSTPLARGWSVAGVGVYRTNRPYTILWGDDRNGTTQYDARPGDRNTAQTGPYRTIDLSVTRRFRQRSMTIEARVDVFNALNTTNYDQYVGELISPLFGRPVSAFPARRIEMAAIARF